MSSAENSELTKRGFKSWQHFDLLICKLQEESKLTEVALEKFEHLKKENEIRYGLKDYVAKPPEKKSKIVTAKYVLYSKFTLPDDRNIEDAHSYWVKWDKLHVIWTEGATGDSSRRLKTQLETLVKEIGFDTNLDFHEIDAFSSFLDHCWIIFPIICLPFSDLSESFSDHFGT